MPIYEYRCRDCQHELERIQKISDAPLSDCPQCGRAALVRLVSAPGFRLKGSGWYETDFKSGNRRNVAGGDDSTAGSSDAGKSGQSENGGAGASKSKPKSKPSGDATAATSSKPATTQTDA